jgi:hypothetical protein
MKNTQKALIILLCGALCAVFLSCATSGGASTEEGYGPGVPYVGDLEFWDDGNDKGNSTIKVEQLTMEGMPAWRFTGNVTTRFQYGYVGWAFAPDANTLELLKTARAISFKFVGDGKRQTVKYRISTVKDHAYHEYHFFGEPGKAERLEVPIKMFMQPSWGQGVRLNQANVTDVSWQTHESWRPGTFEITIWDLRVHP